MNVSNRFTCEISTSTETKSWKKKPTRVATTGKTETEQVLRLILRLLLLIHFCIFQVHAHAFSKYNPSNQSNVWKYAGSYLHHSINTQTYLLRKTSKDRLLLPVVNLDKASICGYRKTSFSFWQKRKIGVHICRDILLPRREGVKGGAISGVLRQRDHMYVFKQSFCARDLTSFTTDLQAVNYYSIIHC